MTMAPVSFGLVVPMLNAARVWPQWFADLQQQSLQPARVLVVDSSSDDETAA